MAARSQYEELARQLSAVGAVKRGLARILPAECPGGSASVLTLLSRYGEMRITRLAELLAVDMSVTSRHVAHAVENGWVERLADPTDRRSRILRLTPAGEELLDDLSRRTTEMFAHNLIDWSDEEVGQLNTLLARLRDSFACRGPGGCTPGRHSGDCHVGHSDDSYTRTPV
ncbi:MULTISPECIES: MarR family winged helix-turn-helix transcriptional regulator [unclassified Streptomyces]|uniref:MarR family winged helix-turn-helix transcriptional regulator n=1 Tax=Streptomyces TaxID=1883 RepID=UPI0001C1B5FB|nr:MULTISPECIES: MarR family winged helix-turn-helix transcriptional regulator [unclassified Streptomyces]MYR67593.1 MarR family transcriptional regulator [Streptomyces sp. SID4939]MYR99121.1 MarR family transcriptional regulator [Streptomyces sp. SID4940]MYT63448.1 MarR family transcriptional regulator [Streptomyces sp. SID8357]MYT85698.1 MarR family transcriptional regulator [Streptomyces sp. SID8360]MYU32866.1 MarR family transcriptional regulator [Streptomyces sp. SID8358]MYW38751.1 MarR 